MNRLPSDHLERMARARLSLLGLALGDAFGGRFFIESPEAYLYIKDAPPGPWFYSDDTIMAQSIVEVLDRHGRIEQDELAVRFAQRFERSPNRGYGAGTTRLLKEIGRGAHWRAAGRAIFDGAGSKGNGGAMRAGPIGAYFCDDLERTAIEARLSAEVTHAHAEGQAGGIAVAVAAGLAARVQSDPSQTSSFHSELLQLVPDGEVAMGIRRAAELAPTVEPLIAAVQLGAGQKVLAADTVPFALWSAWRSRHSFEQALWSTVAGGGDLDTTSAIVGSIVVLSAGANALPTEWQRRCEPLD